MAAALDALAEIEVKIRKPGDWYVSQNVEIKDGSMLRSVCGSGSTPQEAIENHWHDVTDDLGPRYLVVHACGNDRRAVRWNGFMWAEVREPKAAAA